MIRITIWVRRAIILTVVTFLFVSIPAWIAMISKIVYTFNQKEAFHFFQDNRVIFEETVREYKPPERPLFFFSRVEYLTVPETLSEIEEIYYTDGNIWFILNKTPMYGFIHIENQDEIEPWYYIIQIDEGWYYFTSK